VVHLGLHNGDTASWQRFGFGLVERIANAQVQRARQNGDPLNGRMPVRKNLGICRELHAEGKGHRLSNGAFNDSYFGTRG
jgi:hypothetical protein